MESVLPLVFWQGRKPLPTVSVDALGRFIYCPNPSERLGNNEWPIGAQLINAGLFFPTMLVDHPEDRIAALVHQLHSGLRASPYTNGIPRTDLIFFSVVNSTVSDSEINHFIAALEDNCPAPDSSIAEDMLRKLGVYRIPALNYFNARYHTASTSAKTTDRISAIERDGWVRDGRVLRPSVVRIDN